MPKKNITLRFTLTTTITTIIVVVSALIFVIGYIGSTQSILLLSKNLTTEISQSISEKMTNLLNSAEKTNSQINLLISNKSIDFNDKQRLMDLAAQYIDNNEGFTSVDISNVLGNKYKAERMPDDSISRRSYVRDNKQVTMTWYHDNPANKTLFKDSINDLKTGYNPQTRPWWLAAVAAGKPTWTDIYVSGTRKQFVYTCASPIFTKDKKLIAVSSVDLNIINLSEFLETLHISKHGRAFIVNDKKQVIAIPIKNETDLNRLVKKTSEGNSNPYELYQLQEFPDADIRTAIISWLEQKTTGATQANFEFKGTGGVAYLANMVDFPYKPNSHFTIGILIPKNDIFNTINRNSMIMFGIVILCLTFALIIGIQISRRISNSLAKLASEVNKVSHLDLDSSKPVSSIITEVININNSVENMKKGLRSFEKYVPIDLVRQLNSMQKEAVLGGEKKNISILFSDIANFTTISERLSPEVLVENLGVYFSGMSQIIIKNSGTLDKYIGDSIMAFWGAPVEHTNHAFLACISALFCQKYLDELATECIKTGKPVFNTRIGIHTGEVIVGNIGYKERFNYTIIGDNVNLASRLEGLNKYYGTHIIISEDTLNQITDGFITRKLDIVAVKGKSKGIGIYELLGTKNEISESQIKSTNLYNQAIEMYLNRKWQEALPLFQEALQKFGGADQATNIMIERCKEYITNPPHDDWNGIYAFQIK